ncbi:unnamed protein product [Alopecurus aequalis]
MASSTSQAIVKRIGGGLLQRTQPAAEGRPTSLFDTKRGLTGDQKKDAAMRLVQIDHKAEELYDLVAGFEAKYTAKGSLGKKLTRLLNELFTQIQPRPDDPIWRSNRQQARINDCIRQGGGFVTGAVAVDAYFRWYKEKNNNP